MASQGGVNVNLRKFVMKSIPQDAVAVFIGRRRTGKSTLVRDLLFHHQDTTCWLGSDILSVKRFKPAVKRNTKQSWQFIERDLRDIERVENKTKEKVKWPRLLN